MVITVEITHSQSWDEVIEPFGVVTTEHIADVKERVCMEVEERSVLLTQCTITGIIFSQFSDVIGTPTLTEQGIVIGALYFETGIRHAHTD